MMHDVVTLRAPSAWQEYELRRFQIQGVVSWLVSVFVQTFRGSPDELGDFTNQNGGQIWEMYG